MSTTLLESCAAFDRSAEIYDLIHAGKDYDGEAKRVLELLGPAGAGGRALVDWGCGTGEFSRRFSDAGWLAIGIDSDGGMTYQARRKGVDARFGDMCLPVDTKFDAQTCLFAAFSYASAGHPPLLILENFSRAAAPGGKLVFDFVNADAEIRYQQTRAVREVGKHTIGVEQHKRLVDMRLIENDVVYMYRPSPQAEMQKWSELHYMRTFTTREMGDLLGLAGWKLEKFVDLESRLPPESMERYVKSGDPYYLTAVCTAV